jgi:hypothetical protein
MSAMLQWGFFRLTGPLPGHWSHCPARWATVEGDCMSDALSFTEISEQHVELLAARTVMSMFATGTGDGGQGATSDSGSSSKPSADGNPFTFLFGIAGKLLSK